MRVSMIALVTVFIVTMLYMYSSRPDFILVDQKVSARLVFLYSMFYACSAGLLMFVVAYFYQEIRGEAEALAPVVEKATFGMCTPTW